MDAWIHRRGARKQRSALVDMGSRWWRRCAPCSIGVFLGVQREEAEAARWKSFRGASVRKAVQVLFHDSLLQHTFSCMPLGVLGSAMFPACSAQLTATTDVP